MDCPLALVAPVTNLTAQAFPAAKKAVWVVSLQVLVPAATEQVMLVAVIDAGGPVTMVKTSDSDVEGAVVTRIYKLENVVSFGTKAPVFGLGPALDGAMKTVLFAATLGNAKLEL